MVKILNVNGRSHQIDAIAEAATVIREGGLVVYPTETVYGLGADACSDEAVAKVFAAKGRPLESAISVAVSSFEMALEIAKLNSSARKIFKKFMPGPLTLVVGAKPIVSKLLTASTGKIGIRIPDHPVALALIEWVGCPITTTSANISGRPSPRTVREALEQLGDRVDVALDAGRCRLGRPSTVVDISSGTPKIIREGPISNSDLKKLLKEK